MPNRPHSKWTKVYFGADVEKDKPWYIRFVPDFVDLEAAGFSHGLSISGNFFATREAAEKAANLYDKFFDAVAKEIIADAPKAYCKACQSAGMSNCGNFDECGGPACVTCHRTLP
ncbi:hypothetical protein [Acinetobacter sp.]|uniref:hypothetical protein n=1 Tax=Acinetobacter sp. TaxID=472 RepID=UPI0038902886